MNSGARDRKITFYDRVEVNNSLGVDKDNWVEFVSAWASVKHVRANEEFTSRSEISNATMKFTIPYITGITTNMQVEFENERYDVNGKIELSRKRGLEIYCSARVDD